MIKGESAIYGGATLGQASWLRLSCKLGVRYQA